MRKFIIVMAAVLLSLSAAGCGLASSASSGKNRLFDIGEETCSVKEGLVYLVNMRNAYSDYAGLDLWDAISADSSGDASAEEKLEELVYSRLLYIYCLDLMAQEDDITLSAAEEALISQAAQAYYESLSDTDLAYLDTDTSDFELYYTHFALAEKYYEKKTADVTLSSAASTEEEEEQLLEAAKEEAMEAYMEAFVSTVEITIYEGALLQTASGDAQVQTAVFFSIYNEYVSQ